jgi:hypothetical protein
MLKGNHQINPILSETIKETAIGSHADPSTLLRFVSIWKEERS